MNRDIQVGQIYETNGAIVLIVACDSVRQGWYNQPIVGLVLHDDDDMWTVGETLNFSVDELLEHKGTLSRPNARIT